MVKNVKTLPGEDLSARSTDHPERRRQLKKRNPMTWHLRTPKQGPARLAVKNHFIAMIGEYVGTVLFMIFALGGTNVANIPSTSVTGGTQGGQDGSTASTANTSNLLYIALSFGFSLAVNAWIFFRVSGGLFNPAVSLGMALVGALSPLRAALLTVSQILGGITGAAIIQAITPGTLNVRTKLAAGTNVPQGLFIEMFLTSLLMLAILLLAAEKHKATFIAPIGIGLALFVAELLGVYYTGGSLNPARSFGPDVVLRSFESYHWIYWVGPILGAIIAAGFYKMLKVLQYETVLGPESGDDHPVAADNKDHDLSQGGHDEEAAIGSGDVSDEKSKANKQPSYEVSGPGMGDYLTEGNHKAVFDLEQSPGPLEIRLDRLENMIGQLLANSGANPQRASTSTFVEDFDSSPTGLKGHRDLASPGSSVSNVDATHGNRRSRFNDNVQGTTTTGNTVVGGQTASHAHTHPHAPFVPAVAGAEGRPHIDAETAKTTRL